MARKSSRRTKSPARSKQSSKRTSKSKSKKGSSSSSSPNDSDLSKMKVKELRAELDKRGLPVSGRKAELVARLENVLSEESYLIATVEEEEEEDNELNESSSSVMASSFFTTAGDDDDDDEEDEDEEEDYNHEEDLGAVLAEIDENDVAMLLHQEEDDEGLLSTPFVAGTCLTAALMAASLAGEDQSVAWAKKPSHLGLTFASITKSDWVALLLPANVGALLLLTLPVLARDSLAESEVKATKVWLLGMAASVHCLTAVDAHLDGDAPMTFAVPLLLSLAFLATSLAAARAEWWRFPLQLASTSVQSFALLQAALGVGAPTKAATNFPKYMVNVSHTAILCATGGFLLADSWMRVRDALTSVVVFLGQKNEDEDEVDDEE